MPKVASKQNNVSYQSLYLWTSFLLGMISLGIIVWNRGKTSSVAIVNHNLIPVQAGIQENIVIPAQAGIQSSFLDSEFLDSRFHGNDNVVLPLSTYQINFPSFASSLVLSAFAHQLSGNPVINLLSAWPLLFATPVFAQVPRIVVPEFQVTNTSPYRNIGGPCIVSLGSGEWTVTWQDGGSLGDVVIGAHRYGSDGSSLRPQFQLTNFLRYSHTLATLGAGNWVMVARDDSDFSGGVYNWSIYAQRYTREGLPVGKRFRVNTNTNSTKRDNPDVVSLVSGDWVVVWQSPQTGDLDIYAQRYANNGTALGGEFRVNTNTNGTQGYPKLVSLISGEWVVAWASDQTGDYDIYAQRYANNGTALGGEFRVNTNTTGSQGGIALANLATDDWVVVWESDDIYAKRYASNGSVLSPDFRVNTNTTGSQSSATLTSLGSGDWVVAWQRFQIGDGYTGIYAKRFAANGSAMGDEFLVNANTTTQQVQVALASIATYEWVAAWMGLQNGSYNIYASIFSSKSPSLTNILSTLNSANTFSASLPNTSITTTITNQVSSASSITVTMDKPIGSSSVPVSTSPTTNFVPIIAGVGVGGFSLAACLGAIGFYAYRKKSRANKAGNAAEKKVGTSLQDEPRVVSLSQNYSRIDEFRRVEKQYDEPIKLEIKSQNYAGIDEVKKVENQYDNAPKLEI